MDIEELTPIQRLVILKFTKFLVRRMIPWKRHVEHAIKKAVINVANVADRDLVVKTRHRILLGNGSTDRYMPDSAPAVLYTVITLRCALYSLGYKYRGMGLRISNPP